MADYNPAGAAITDEAVACTESITVNGSALYRGQLAEMPGRAVLGNTDPTYMIRSAAGGGGTRFLVLEFDADPADSDPGVASPPDVALDLTSGFIYSTISQTVYVTYLAHGTFITEPASGSNTEPVVVKLDIPFLMPSGTTTDHVITSWHETVKFTDYCLWMPSTGGIAPTANMSLSLRNATGGGGSAAVNTLDLTAGSKHSGWNSLGGTFTITSAQNIVIRGDGKNAQGLQIWLKHDPSA